MLLDKVCYFFFHSPIFRSLWFFQVANCMTTQNKAQQKEQGKEESLNKSHPKKNKRTKKRKEKDSAERETIMRKRMGMEYVM